jgi:hypothetical protein
MDSYSFSYPYSSTGAPGKWWSNLTDASLPIASDAAPVNNQGNPARNQNTGDPTGAKALTKLANSWVHQTDGQNVAFGDAHVDFTRLPNVGQSNDNIWTINGVNAGVPTQGGTPSAGGGKVGTGGGAVTDFPGGTQGSYDVIMVPQSNDIGTRQ